MHAAARLGEPFELVVLDGQMPGMDGIELAQAISLAPSLRGARLVMLTSTTDRRVAAREAGIDHYLQKPVRRRRLLEVVAEAMGAAAEPPVEPLAAGDPETTHQDTLLIVEDNAVNQRVIEAMLAKRGFAVEVANNGREALTMLSVRSYPLIFMDCQMPEMDGYAATAAIRSRETGDGPAADRGDDRARDEGRPRTLPAPRAWTTTSPSRCARRSSTVRSSAGSASRPRRA